MGPGCVGGNPAILRALRAGPRRWSIDVEPWSSHGEFVSALSRASVFAAPPGITSIAEAWSVAVPFLALPGQHYAHWTILQRLRGGDDSVFPGIAPDIEPAVDGLTSMTSAVLKAAVSELSPGAEARDAAVERVRDFLLQGQSGRAQVVSRQGDRLAELFGDSDGSVYVAREALRLC